MDWLSKQRQAPSHSAPSVLPINTYMAMDGCILALLTIFGIAVQWQCGIDITGTGTGVAIACYNIAIRVPD